LHILVEPASSVAPIGGRLEPESVAGIIGISNIAGNSSNLVQQIHIALKMSEEERMAKSDASRAIAENISKARAARLTIDQLVPFPSK